MARDNYSYKKNQKELAQKKKREAKMQSRLEKKNARAKVAADPAPDRDATADSSDTMV